MPGTDTRVVVLTGANGGIGRYLARTLVADGYRVAGLDRETEFVERIRDAAPDRVAVHDVDVTDAAAVRAAVDDVVENWGRVDVLVNAAGIASVAPFDAHDPADARREFDVNYFGYANAIRAVLPHMRAQGGGIVHNVSSGTAIGGHPGMSGYAATKGAVEALSKSLRIELAPDGIAVTRMQPPMTRTRLTDALDYPDWFLADPEDVGRKLARQIERTDRVVYADRQTRIGLAVVERLPWLWARATRYFTDLDATDPPVERTSTTERQVEP
jgi:NAD(P)-dependent dehydrogenase (short-subunit alcohol dehydrogenase family)